MSPVFAAWQVIRKRSPLCERWGAFPNFARDVGPRPSWRCLIIRDDPSAEFSPSNAGWRVAERYRWRSTPRHAALSGSPTNRKHAACSR